MCICVWFVYINVMTDEDAGFPGIRIIGCEPLDGGAGD